jgi:hypothetical protein
VKIEVASKEAPGFRALEKSIVGSFEIARFTVELQARRGFLSFSRGEKVAGTAG